MLLLARGFVQLSALQCVLKVACLHVVECVIVLVRVLVKCLENVTIVQIFAREVALVVAMALVRIWQQEKIQ